MPNGEASRGPERTPDGHYIIVKGRKWRATDPVLDEEIAARLRQHLGTARSRIRRCATEEEKAPWRARVQLAKEGLGERGQAWWELDEDTRAARASHALERLDADTIPPQPGGPGKPVIAPH